MHAKYEKCYQQAQLPRPSQIEEDMGVVSIYSGLLKSGSMAIIVEKHIKFNKIFVTLH